MSPEMPFIYKEPNKSIHTRKKERVSEADTLWAFRPDGPASDPTRINEAIRYFAAGVNPSVEIDYTGMGRGSQTTVAKSNSAGALYKLDVVRPPLFPIETTMPLSRPRTHQNKSVETNPGLNASDSSASVAGRIDNTIIEAGIRSEHQAALPITVQATSHYQISEPFPMSAKWAIQDDTFERFNFSTNPGNTQFIGNDESICRETSPYGTIIRPSADAYTNPTFSSQDRLNRDGSGHTREKTIIEHVKPNFQLVIYSPANHVSTEVQASIKEKQNIAIRAAMGLPIELNRGDGTKIKLSGKNWTAVQTNIGLDQVILTVDSPDIQLERNLPLYAATSMYSSPTDITERYNPDLDLESKITTEAYTPIDMSQMEYHRSAYDQLQNNTKLDDIPEYGSFQGSFSTIPKWNSLPPIPVKTRENVKTQRPFIPSSNHRSFESFA